MKNLASKLLLVFLGLAFCAPYFFAFSQAIVNAESLTLFLGVLPYSLLQSLSSTFATIFLGIWGALGLFWLEKKLSVVQYGLCEFIILLPSLLPAIFLIVSALSLIPYFPFGLSGVIFLHTLSEIGLAALVIKKIFSQKLSFLSEFAFLSGSSRLFFLRKSWSLVFRDISQLSVIFAVYFLTSFSIPLLIAGRTYSTIEVVIYRLIVVNHNWPVASTLVILQLGLISAMLIIINSFGSEKIDLLETKSMKVLNHFSGVIVLFVPVFILIFGLLRSIPGGIYMLQLQQDVWIHWYDYLIGSLLIGFLTAGIVHVFLTLTSYAFYLKYFRKFVSIFFTPSYVAISFGFLLLYGFYQFSLSFYVSWALAIAFLPALFRLGVMQVLESIEGQVEFAQHIGSSSVYTFRKIVYPQVLPQICLVSGLAGLWGVGDFSLSRVIIGTDITLAMWVQSLVEQYRWDMAALFSILILLAGLIVFSFFWSASYVCRQKLS